MKPAGQQLPVEVGAPGYNTRDPEPPGEVKSCMSLLKRQEKSPLAKPRGPRASNKTPFLDLTGG